jgi:hypothetical protein
MVLNFAVAFGRQTKTPPIGKIGGVEHLGHQSLKDCTMTNIDAEIKRDGHRPQPRGQHRGRHWYHR